MSPCSVCQSEQSWYLQVSPLLTCGQCGDFPAPHSAHALAVPEQCCEDYNLELNDLPSYGVEMVMQCLIMMITSEVALVCVTVWCAESYLSNTDSWDRKKVRYCDNAMQRASKLHIRRAIVEPQRESEPAH
eukprot:9557-Amphidinium_carterae.1